MNGRLLFGVMLLLTGLGSAAGVAPAQAQAQAICSTTGVPDRVGWTQYCQGRQTNTGNPTYASLELSSIQDNGFHWSWHITNQLVCTDAAPLHCAFGTREDYIVKPEGEWTFVTSFPPETVDQFCQCGRF